MDLLNQFGAPVNLIMALRALTANKLRALLTMLGVIIGVGAVIVAVAIGQGSKAAVAESIKRLGTNVLTVFPGQQRSGGIGRGANTTLKYEDAAAILAECPAVGRVSPQVNSGGQVKYGNKNTNVTINGTGTDYPLISNQAVETGQFFTSDDLNSRARVAVLGATTASDLFGTEFPIGKTIRVANQNFTVVGVLKKKGGQGFMNPDDAVYVPVTTAMHRLFGQKNVGTITAQARSEDLMSEAQTEITNLLRTRHKIATGAENDFRIFNQADIAEAQDAQQNTFSSLITYLAIISLVVGGIGIMNIMLVSVTERTREIGVRKAIGARRADILTQFLVEALLLSLVGGLLGVAFGIGGAKAVELKNGWTMVIAPQTILLAFSFSALVGVFFGFYPALKASRLNPIDALRYE